MDIPIAHAVDGRPIYDNTPSVVSVAVVAAAGILAIRRAGVVGHGKLCLPGGYHMRGETWQAGGAREVLEETGYAIDPDRLTCRHTLTDSYGNNMIFARHEGDAELTAHPLDREALEVVFLSEGAMDPEDWAFPLHFAFARRALADHALGMAHLERLDALAREMMARESLVEDGLGTDHRALAQRLLRYLEEADPNWRSRVGSRQGLIRPEATLRKHV